MKNIGNNFACCGFVIYGAVSVPELCKVSISPSNQAIRRVSLTRRNVFSRERNSDPGVALLFVPKVFVSTPKSVLAPFKVRRHVRGRLKPGRRHWTVDSAVGKFIIKIYFNICRGRVVRCRCIERVSN